MLKEQEEIEKHIKKIILKPRNMLFAKKHCIKTSITRTKKRCIDPKIQHKVRGMI